MGRIKTQLIKRTARKLFNKYPGEAKINFDENKARESLNFSKQLLKKIQKYNEIAKEKGITNFAIQRLPVSINNIHKSAINVVENNMSMILGKMYVAKYFDETKKHKMQTLISHIMNEFKHRLETNDWMANETKQKALENTISIMLL